MGRVQTQNATQKLLKSDDKKKGRALAEALTFLKAQWSWSGTTLEEVTHIPATTINSWIANKFVPIEERQSNNVQAILHLIAVHKDLDSIFEQPENQLQWLNTKHPDFGEAPIEKMKKSMEGLIGVRQYLDYVRGRGA